jgi:hypothetical protein
VTGDAGNRAQDPNDFDSLTIDVTVTINGVAHTEKALIDSGSQANFISQRLVKQWGLREDSTSSARTQTITGDPFFVYGEHQVRMSVTDSARKTKNHRLSFLAADIRGEGLVLGYPWLAASNPNVNWPFVLEGGVKHLILLLTALRPNYRCLKRL